MLDFVEYSPIIRVRLHVASQEIALWGRVITVIAHMSADITTLSLSFLGCNFDYFRLVIAAQSFLIIAEFVDSTLCVCFLEIRLHDENVVIVIV